MKLHDQHLHSRFSFDCKTDPAANVEAAIARGLCGLTFTEHYDTHPDDWPGCVYDDEAYSAAIEDVRERYRDRLFIGKGIEVCFQPEQMPKILHHLRSHRFDVVLVSVHYFGGKPAHVRENWHAVDAATGIDIAMRDVLTAVTHIRDLHRREGRVFDVLSHLDFAKRYAHRYCGSFDMTPHRGIIEDTLGAYLEASLIPEINTSTFRQGLGESMPNAEAVMTYARLGGKAMSIGSDSHSAEHIGADFDKAVAMLREAGINQTVVFKSRDVSFLPCGDVV